MSVTSQPCFASQIACRPPPPARSSALPGCGNSGRIYPENARARKGSGTVHVSAPAASRYFWFQRSRSLSEEEVNDMLCDSNPPNSPWRRYDLYQGMSLGIPLRAGLYDLKILQA